MLQPAGCAPSSLSNPIVLSTSVPVTFGGYYEHGQTCVWLITGGDSAVLAQVDFAYIFVGGSSGDTLSLYDGATASAASKIVRGSSKQVIATGGQLLVVFTSGYGFSSSSFMMTPTCELCEGALAASVCHCKFLRVEH